MSEYRWSVSAYLVTIGFILILLMWVTRPGGCTLQSEQNRLWAEMYQDSLKWHGPIEERPPLPWEKFE